MLHSQIESASELRDYTILIIVSIIGYVSIVGVKSQYKVSLFKQLFEIEENDCEKILLALNENPKSPFKKLDKIGVLDFHSSHREVFEKELFVSYIPQVGSSIYYESIHSGIIQNINYDIKENTIFIVCEPEIVLKNKNSDRANEIIESFKSDGWKCRNLFEKSKKRDRGTLDDIF